MRNKFHIYAYCISIFAIFALIYYPAFYIPFHSDDYSYFLKGTSFKADLEHYLGWKWAFYRGLYFFCYVKLLFKTNLYGNKFVRSYYCYYCTIIFATNNNETKINR